jgi:hypothetical protein
MPAKRGHAPVAFDETAWSEDLRDTTDAGRAAAIKITTKSVLAQRASLEHELCLLLEYGGTCAPRVVWGDER